MFAPKRNEHPLHYWISFWPVAPLFGVPWRFEALMPSASFFKPADVAAQMSRAGAAEAAKVVEEAADTAVRATEAASKVVDAVVVEMTPPPAAAAPAEPEAVKPAPVEPAPVEPAPAPEAVAPASLMATAPRESDDLKLIKGVGPKLESLLNQLGVYTFAQIAGFSVEDRAWVEAALAERKARPLPDDWAAQASALA